MARSVRGTRLTPLAGLAPVLCVPTAPLATEAARQVLPATVPHADAAANSARSALLVAALTGDGQLLFDATEEFLHQRYRAGCHACHGESGRGAKGGGGTRRDLWRGPGRAVRCSTPRVTAGAGR